jgi:uncharacterized membrane protein
MEHKSLFARWRASFLAGFAVTLPAIISIAAFLWVFKTVSNLTNLLLFFLPKGWTHQNAGAGDMYWYWSVVALLLAVALISAVGVLARYYVGKKIIKWTDHVLLRVPLLNKFYGAVKQVNEAFAGNKNSFKTVVLVEFPRAGTYSVGFITSEQHAEVQQKTREKVVSVFVPTTPNPTSGFLILVPEDKVTKLEMSVAEGIKFIVSLGSLATDLSAANGRELKPATAENAQ